MAGVLYCSGSAGYQFRMYNQMNSLQEFSGLGRTRSHRLQSTPVRSQFSDDPDFAELLEFFVEALPERREFLTSCHQSNDVDGLRVAAHQLKGAGGGYGFDQLSSLAAQLEEACKAADRMRMRESLDLLIEHIDCITL